MASIKLTIVFSDCGHNVVSPSGVEPQSYERMRAPISPPKDGKERSERSGDVTMPLLIAYS